MKEKICTKCKNVKESIEFRKRGVNLFSWCKKCESEANRKRFLLKNKNKNEYVKYKPKKTKEEIKIDALKRMLKHRYNITYDDYVNMYKNQKERCGICGRHVILGTPKGLYIDHCHETGKVRSLLCSKCNSGLGMFNEDISLLIKVIKYILNHNTYNQ